MEKLSRWIRMVALALAVLTAVWVVLLVILMSPVKHYWRTDDYIVWLLKSPKLQFLSYLNVVALTLINVAWFALLYLHFKKEAPHLSLLGLIFVPIYGVINFVCYGIQLVAVPRLAQKVMDGESAYQFVGQLIQADPNSLVGALNGYAYGILGIPLIIMGHLLTREITMKSGYLLIGSGTMSLIGALGMMLNSQLLAKGITLGGGLYLAALILFFIEFKPQSGPT